MVTDVLSDYFFVTEESGIRNLLKEGKPKERIHFVGNVMVDNLFHQVARLEKTSVEDFQTASLKRDLDGYAFLTLHRPPNWDGKAAERIWDVILG